MKLTVEDFIKFRDVIYDKAGLFFETKKIYFVKKRLQKRMEALDLATVTDYYNLLKYRDKFGGELQELLNQLTTNETYFFREDNQLRVFRDHCLNRVLAEKGKRRNKQLRIWSAGCSSGEEPYTLAIMMREKFPMVGDWNIEITATDIDTGILERAKQAVYNSRSVRFVPPLILQKYFIPIRGTEDYTLSVAARSMVQFKHLNLFEHLRMRIMRSFDFVFCRNVLIYFDEASRRTVMAHFYDSLNPGGYIYLGHSESVTRTSSAFVIERAGGLIVHRKPLPQEV